MIFTRQRLIYLHLQKTGGNSITRAFLPHSDDKMTLRKHQDGSNRFGVTGAITPRKHALLAEYRKALGRDFASYKVAISVRDPLDRAVSMYYSPHRWMTQIKGEWVQQDAYWDFDRFSRVMQTMQSISDFLRIRKWGIKTVQPPDTVIRYESLLADLTALARAYDLPFNPDTFPHANKSAANQDLREEAKLSEPVRDLVQRRFADDYRLLEKLG